MAVLDAYGLPYGDAIAVRKPSGAVIVDGAHVADTVQCKHCGGHFVMQRGSGVTRGWCVNCDGMICGPSCATCLPQEKWLDQTEKFGHRPR